MRARPRFSGADIASHIRRMTLVLRGEAGAKLFGKYAGKTGGEAAQDAGKTGGAAGGGISEQVREQARGLIRQRDQATGEAARLPGWWVLAQGGSLDPEDFAAREAAREALLAQVRQAGVLVGENVWVWDETGRAQLVLSTLPTAERARRVAERLRQKGLSVIVRREMA